jgi:hypothetical protein
LLRFEIVDIAPAQICASAKTASFLVKGFHIDVKKVTAIFGTSVVQLTPQMETGVFQVNFTGGPFGQVKSNVPLSLTNGGDISSVPVQLVQCDKPEEQAKVSVFGTKTIAEKKDNKYRFTVILKDLDSSLVNDKLRIGALPTGHLKDWVVSLDEPLKAVPGFKNTYEASFSANPAGTEEIEKLFDRPIELQVALLPDGNRNKVDLVKGTVIYYPEKEAALAKVKGLGTLSRQGEEVTITLPRLYKQAYPDVANSKLRAEISDQPNIGLTADADFTKANKDDEVKGTVKLKDEASEKAWKELKVDSTVKFSFDGTNTPEIRPVAIPKKQ